MKYTALLAATFIFVSSELSFAHAEDGFGARFGNAAPSALESDTRAVSSEGTKLSEDQLYELLQITPAAGEESEQNDETFEDIDISDETENSNIDNSNTEDPSETEQYGHWSAESDESAAEGSPLTDSDGTIDAAAGNEDAIEDELELQQEKERQNNETADHQSEND